MASTGPDGSFWGHYGLTFTWANDFDLNYRHGNAKIYNVQQRVSDFIIGEYGTITNSGQTLQGVRYTAVADDHSGVDPNLIYETLLKYFPMAAAKFAESNSRAAS